MSFKAFFLSLTIVAILMFSAFGTIPVYADDGTTTDSTEVSAPPATEDSSTAEAGAVATDATAQPEATAVATEATAQPEETAVATEATAQPEETAVATEATVQPEATAAPEVSPAPTLEQLPDNTTVTVVNSDGEAQPLATQESADAIASAYDPIWCPEGQSPTPGANGCTSSFSSFTALLTYLQANESDPNYQQAGTIYIQNGQYLGGESSIVINPTPSATSLNNYNLTLQGGWNTVDNTTTDTTQFNVPITVGSSGNPWIGSLTFNNIFISGVGNQAGLTAYSASDITLSNVQVTNSQTGANLTAGGQVTVDKSKFNNNKKAGANITSKLATTPTSPAVTINDSEFNGNGFGANITAAGAVNIGDSFFSGNVSYTYNCKGKTATGGYGLKVVTTGNIDAGGVQANNNYDFGAYLTGSDIYVHAGSDTFGNSTFDNNGYGLKVVSQAPTGTTVTNDNYITLQSIEANNNKLFGADVQADRSVTVNNSFFNGNKSYTYSCKGNTYAGYGLQIVTTSGIYLTDVTASGNNLFGAHLDGQQVNIYGGFFNNNGSGSASNLTGKGVEIISDSLISITNIEANNNQLFGANMQAVGNVTITKGFFNGNKVYTSSCKGQTVAGGGYGLQIVTGGDITITTIGASDNYSYGAHLTGANVDISSAASGVLNTFDNNGSGSLQNPTGEGLKIVSSKNVSLLDISASNNQLFGADIKADGDVSITASIGATSLFNGNKAYTYSCKGSTYAGYGLKVVSTNGDISLANIAADKNYNYGAHLEGANVYVSYGSFSNNGTGNPSDHVGKGLEIVSTGELTQVNLYQVHADNNQLFGADITADGVVIVNTSTFNGNLSYTSTCKGKTYDGYGLKVVTASNIDVFDVAANENGLYGAHLEGVNVSVNATPGLFSTFSNNGSGDQNNPTGKGLEVVSTGDVTLINTEANNNQLFGANIQTDDGTVSISNSVFSGNVSYTSGTCKTTKQGYGLKVVTLGNINLTPGANGVGVTASDNGAEGAMLEGDNVVVVNSTFTGNGATGLTITANNVTLSGVTASNNGIDGAKVCAPVVSVFGSTFETNNRYGLNVGSPQFVEAGNVYTGNGTAGLFSNPTCVTDSGSNNNGWNHNNWWSNWWKDHGKSFYGHQFGHSYYGGGSDKTCHSIGKTFGSK